MGKLLYCKNKPVYDIDKQQVLSVNLLPGYMRMNGTDKPNFMAWLKLRYNKDSNRRAERMRTVIFGTRKRTTINAAIHALNLSDCYWVKDSAEDITFEQVSPYYVPYWHGHEREEYIHGMSIPDICTPGTVSKEWLDSKSLIKYTVDRQIEYKIYKLCKACDVSVVPMMSKYNGTLIMNMTTPDIMLEQVDQSGRARPSEFNKNTIEKLFGVNGIRYLVIDAIVCAGNRDSSNMGWLRDANTGAYIGIAPLYGFGHTLKNKSSLDSDNSINDIVELVGRDTDYIIHAANICKAAMQHKEIDKLFSKRAAVIYNKLVKKYNLI